MTTNPITNINNNKQNIIRAATYGSLPLRTLPGSIVHKEIFNTCGLLVGSVRAGEDGDWMRRVNLHKLKMEESKERKSGRFRSKLRRKPRRNQGGDRKRAGSRTQGGGSVF